MNNKELYCAKGINDRTKELEKVKKIIKKYINEADCGIFSTRNIAGDTMVTIFKGKYFEVDICYYYSYFEIFGTTQSEFKYLETYYYSIGGI